MDVKYCLISIIFFTIVLKKLFTLKFFYLLFCMKKIFTQKILHSSALVMEGLNKKLFHKKTNSCYMIKSLTLYLNPSMIQAILLWKMTELCCGWFDVSYYRAILAILHWMCCKQMLFCCLIAIYSISNPNKSQFTKFYQY